VRKALHILGILDDLDVEWMATQGSTRHFDAGATLIQEGQPIDAIYILLEGQLAVFVGKSNATHFATLLPGEVVGEISFVDSRPPLASVVAVQDSLVLMLPREALAIKLGKDQAFASRFYRAIASFLADRLYVTVGRFGYGSARQDVDPDELQDSFMEEVSMASIRFDKLLRHLRGDYRVRTAN
jgi:CRP/FNR family cyclic AMP-dependent transcriptional regulator